MNSLTCLIPQSHLSVYAYFLFLMIVKYLYKYVYILTWIRYWNFFVFFYSCNLKTYFATLDFLMVCFYSFLFFFPFFLFSIVFWIVLYLSREKKRGNIVLRLPRSGSNTSLELFLRRGEDWGTRRKTLGTSAFVLANTKAGCRLTRPL